MSEEIDTNSNNCTYHTKADKEGIVVDLGQLRDIDNIVLLRHEHPSKNYRYKIKLSGNKTDWITVAEVENTVARATVENIGSQDKSNPWVAHIFQRSPVRYISVHGSCVSHRHQNFSLVSLKTYLRRNNCTQS